MSERKGYKSPRDGERSNNRPSDDRPKRKRKRIRRPPVGADKAKKSEDQGPVRLNKYIANAGVCSRREADQLIASGAVAINGEVVKTLGTKVNPGDKVTYNGKRLYSSNKVYLLLNKPKDYITTTNDPENRHTVMELVDNAGVDRVFPVGRLDRNTTGILLFTNDGDLMQKLIHPSSKIEKVYSALLDRRLAKKDMEQLLRGVELEDGVMHADRLAYIDKEDPRKIGIEIHSGRNRIIHRMFEHLNYKVLRLDRVLFAGLDKRGLKRGEWRFLNEKEIRQLRIMTKSSK